MSNSLISVVIPAYNEEGSIEVLYKKIAKVLSNLKKPYEIIFVDDGSNDSTFEIVSKLHKIDSRVKAIRLRGNFGKSIALQVGFDQAAGDIVFTMDADLQDDPEEIPNFLTKLEEGYD